jgi:hypothetical protein
VALTGCATGGALLHHPRDVVRVVWFDQFGTRGAATVRLATGAPA